MAKRGTSIAENVVAIQMNVVWGRYWWLNWEWGGVMGASSKYFDINHLQYVYSLYVPL